jgi:putative transposase
MVSSYRIGRRSIRLKGYDYRNGGTYFVTICTQNRESVLGEVRGNIVGLSDMGCVVQQCWDEMPNHVHGILYISDITERRGLACQTPTDVERRYSKPIAGSLGTIISAFKSACTKQMHLEMADTQIGVARNAPTIWQRNYHEHIIRSEDERFRIRRYIMNNPTQWNIHPDDLL